MATLRSGWHNFPRGLSRRVQAPVLVVMMLTLLALGGACTKDDADRIREQNERAEHEAAGDDDTDAEVTAFDLEVGDCFIEPRESASTRAEFREIELVPCSSSRADFRVSRVFKTRQLNLPAGADFSDEAAERCPASSVSYFYPSFESWEAGDRVITCLNEAN